MIVLDESAPLPMTAVSRKPFLIEDGCGKSLLIVEPGQGDSLQPSIDDKSVELSSGPKVSLP